MTIDSRLLYTLKDIQIVNATDREEIMQKTISINKYQLELLVESYNKAVKEDKEVFIFNGNEFYTPYAKYLIQYLSHQFNVSHNIYGG